MNVLTVGVVGSRSRNTQEDKELIRKALKYLMVKDKNVRIHLVSGGAKLGADRFVEELADELQLGISIHLPDKSKMQDESKYEYVKQLFARNTLIAEECDILIALWDGKSSGTKDTIKKAENLNKPIVIL